MRDHGNIGAPGAVDVEADTSAFVLAGEPRDTVSTEELESFQAQRDVRDVPREPGLGEAQSTGGGKVSVSSHQQR